MQHIVVYTAVMVDAGHAQWAENAAGFHHSNQHGFGLLDAYRMTRVAGVTTSLTVCLYSHTLCSSAVAAGASTSELDLLRVSESLSPSYLLPANHSHQKW